MGLLAYAQRWAGGFTDGNNAKPVDAQFLNAVETALLGLLGANPVDGQLEVYDNALGRFKPTLITNAHIDAAAAIAKSKLAALNISDADISAGAAIAASKLAGNIPASKLANYPGALQQVLRGDGSFAQGTQGIYRKTSSKQVVNTVAETDLLNGEITIGAGVLGTNGILRLSAMGDFINNSGATQAGVRLKLKLGATTLIDTAAPANFWGSSASRFPWKVDVQIANLGVANSQWANLNFQAVSAVNVGTSVATFAVGEGLSFGALFAGGTGPVTAHGSTAGPVAIDTTVSQALVLSVILPSTSPSLDMTLRSAVVELI